MNATNILKEFDAIYVTAVTCKPFTSVRDIHELILRIQTLGDNVAKLDAGTVSDAISGWAKTSADTLDGWLRLKKLRQSIPEENITALCEYIATTRALFLETYVLPLLRDALSNGTIAAAGFALEQTAYFDTAE